MQIRCSGQAVQKPETARLSRVRGPSSSRGQHATEGSRVKQVGEKLSRRAVVWVAMCWLSEPYHPLGCVSSTFLAYL